MHAISGKRHRIPPEVLRHAEWLYFRFTLSLRDFEELLADEIWYGDCGQHSPRPPQADRIGHLDAMVVRIQGQRTSMWRAADRAEAVLEMLVQKCPNKAAALKLLRKLLKTRAIFPRRS